METTHRIHQLTVKNITKTIKGRKILEDISLTVSQGQMFAILGPTGIVTFDLFCIRSSMKFCKCSEISENTISGHLVFIVLKS